MGLIIRYKHHTDETVAVIDELRGRHRDHCLCFQGCRFFKPDTPANCALAQELFEYDKRNNMVTPVWECPKFEQIDP